MKKCTVEGCDNKHHSKGYCQKHYNQMKYHGHILEDKELEDFIAYFLLSDEYTDLDCTNNYELSEYTTEVGDDDLPF